MVREDMLRERLRLLAEYVIDLEGAQEIDWAEFSENKILRRFVERTLQLAMEACLDIGSHIIASEGYREPSNNRSIFEILHENGWAPDPLKERLSAMASFRNVLVHDYATLDSAIVFEFLKKHLPELKQFGSHVLAKLDPEQ